MKPDLRHKLFRFCALLTREWTILEHSLSLRNQIGNDSKIINVDVIGESKCYDDYLATRIFYKLSDICQV